jgi:lysophospholipase L1-like esterase
MLYKEKVLLMHPSNIIQFIPMDETIGTVATDASGNNRNGTFTVCTLNQEGFKTGEKSVLLDGVSSWIQLHSASLNTAFNPDEFTMSLWCKSTVTPWGAGPLPHDRWTVLFWFQYDADNYVQIFSERNSNTLAWKCTSGGVLSVKYFSMDNPLFNDWMHILITGSVSNNELKFFLNGVQITGTVAYSGWSDGSLTPVATSISYAYLFTGYVSHFALWDIPLSNAEIGILADVKKSQSMVVFGDSITVGLNATDYAHQFPTVLSGLINAPVIINAGVSGTLLQNTVQNSVSTIGGTPDNNGRDRFITAILNCNSDYVFILYGLNDYCLNDDAITVALFEHDLNEIVAGLIAAGFDLDKIVLGSPTYKNVYTGGAPFNAGSEVKRLQYATSVQSVAVSNGCIYADIGGYLLSHGGATLLSNDNIHPNDAGHAAIAQAFFNALIATNLQVINVENTSDIINVSQYIDEGKDVQLNCNVTHIILNSSGYVNFYGIGYSAIDSKRIYLSAGKLHNISGIGAFLSSGTDKGIGIHIKL